MASAVAGERHLPAGPGSARPARSRWRWILLLVAWVALAAGALPFALRLGSAEDHHLIDLLPSGAPSTVALRLDKAFPSGRSARADVVFYRRSGLTTTDAATIDRERALLPARLGAAIGPPSVAVYSPARTAAVVSVPVRGNETAAARTVGRIRAALGRDDPGLVVHVTGDAAIQADLFGAFSGADSLLLGVTAALVAVLLAVSYRSPFLWLLPLVCVGLAEAVAEAVVYGLAAGGITINGQSASLVTVMVFGAGTDYALLLTARYREELHLHADPARAMAVAWRRAAPAVAASAATVACALGCLLVARLRITVDFGVVGVVGVLVAAAVTLGAYPAMLVLAGRRVFWPSVPVRAEEKPAGGVWGRVASSVARGRRLLWVGGVLVLAGAAAGLATVDTNLSTLSELPASSGSVQGYDLLHRAFPAGEVSPVDVVVTDGLYTAPLRRALARLPVTAAEGPVEVGGDMARFDLILSVPPTGPQGFSAIRQLRAEAGRVGGDHVLIGGLTAQDLDTATASHRDTLLIVPAVLAVVAAILALVLRALLGPLLVVVTVVLSYGAALGLVSALVVPALGLPGTDPTVPLLTFVFLVALGTDYNIFLLTRMREEVRRSGMMAGIRAGVASTGSVLTSAGLVLAGTFAVLAVLPIVASREIGLVVAVGVLVDTLLVRTILLPTLMADLGRAFWWPARPGVARLKS